MDLKSPAQSYCLKLDKLMEQNAKLLGLTLQNGDLDAFRGIVFVCRALRHDEIAEWSDTLGYGRGQRAVLAAFKAALQAIEGLTVEEKPFDPREHLEMLPYSWKVLAGDELWRRSSLSPDERKNSGGPSDASDRAASTPDAISE